MRRGAWEARLQATLGELLDDGTGQIRPALQPLAVSLLAMPRPDRALNWRRKNPPLPAYLNGLCPRQIDLSHQGFDERDGEVLPQAGSSA